MYYIEGKLKELDTQYNQQLIDDYDVINYLIDNDKPGENQKCRKRIGYLLKPITFPHNPIESVWRRTCGKEFVINLYALLLYSLFCVSCSLFYRNLAAILLQPSLEVHEVGVECTREFNIP